MFKSRRLFLYRAGALLAFLAVGRVRAGAKPSLAVADALAGALAQASGGAETLETDQIRLEVPDIAEDGALVPVVVESELPEVSSIWLFVEKNPVPLAARFHLDGSLDPYVSLRIKMNESGELVALVQSGGGFFTARKKVRVLLGGCG